MTRQLYIVVGAITAVIAAGFYVLGSAWLRHQSAVSTVALPASFVEAYSLDPSEVVKRIAKPVDGRAEFLSRHDVDDNLVNDVAVSLWWSDDGLEMRGCDFGSQTRPRTLARVVVNSLLIPAHLVKYEGIVAEVELPGDWVTRKGASIKAILTDLARIVENEVDEEIRVEKRKRKRPTISVSGRCDPRVIQAQEGQVNIYLDETDITGIHLVGGGSGSVKAMLRWLGNWLAAEVVNHAKDSQCTVSWEGHLGRQSYSQAEMERILDNISAQTGLVFEYAVSEGDVFVITSRN